MNMLEPRIGARAWGLERGVYNKRPIAQEHPIGGPITESRRLRWGVGDKEVNMKARLYRLAFVASLVVVLIEGLGAPAKW
jgi:hypothetical protein